MTRRMFLAAFPATALACAGAGHPTDDRQADARIGNAHATEDARLALLRHAIQAPSSHNTQPWLVGLDQDHTIDVYIDPHRRLPLCDPFDRQTFVSQGTFLEALALASLEHGWRPEVRLAEDEQAAAAGQVPVAHVILHQGADVSRDPLFRFISRRQTSKRIFDDRRCPDKVLQALVRAATARDTASVVIDSPAACRRIAEICAEAMRIDVASPARNTETAAWFRFSDEEARRSRDGFGLAANGTAGVAKWIAETFVLSRATAADPDGSFATGAITTTRRQAQSAAAFGVITTAANTRFHQVLAGRAYLRMQLAATALGVQTHPLSQALQEYPEMESLHGQLRTELGVPDGHVVQMLYRIGYAEPAPRTLRRDARDLVRRG